MENQKGVSLLGLAEHLEGTQLLHEKFDINFVNSLQNRDSNYCGTNGCAIGEMPALDNRVKFVVHSQSALEFEKMYFTASEFAEHYWGLTEEESLYLFYPKDEFTRDVGLDVDATKEEVAANIRKFVELTGKNECVIK